MICAVILSEIERRKHQNEIRVSEDNSQHKSKLWINSESSHIRMECWRWERERERKRERYVTGISIWLMHRAMMKKHKPQVKSEVSFRITSTDLWVVERMILKRLGERRRNISTVNEIGTIWTDDWVNCWLVIIVQRQIMTITLYFLCTHPTMREMNSLDTLTFMNEKKTTNCSHVADADNLRIQERKETQITPLNIGKYNITIEK